MGTLATEVKWRACLRFLNMGSLVAPMTFEKRDGCMKKINALEAFVIALSMLAAPLLAHANGDGQFIIRCSYDHSLPDDPIVFPQLPAASHLHDFLGALTTNAFSSYASMRAGGTNCSTPDDTAGYWTPALYRNGVLIEPRGTGPTGINVRPKIYYSNTNLLLGTRVEPLPADLRIIAGNGHAASPSENPKLGKEIYWGCSDNSTSKLIAPPASCATGIISLHVGFPNCWDGVLTHKNDTAHLAYPSGGVCKAPFIRPLPRVILRWEYPVGINTGIIALSSGPTYTAHGDFWNTWNQERLNSLNESCINKNVRCGTLTK